MSEKNQQHNIADNIPKAVVKEKRTLSLIWLIPLVALAIGIWLTVKAINEKGPTVTIAFKSAEGDIKKVLEKFIIIEQRHTDVVRFELDYASHNGFWLGFPEISMEVG